MGKDIGYPQRSDEKKDDEKERVEGGKGGRKERGECEYKEREEHTL